MSDVEIRSCETAVERSAAVALVQESLQPEWQFPDETVSDALADALVALHGGTLVGCVGFVRGERPGISIVAVSPGHRLRGIGSCLVSSALSEVKESALIPVAAARRRNTQLRSRPVLHVRKNCARVTPRAHGNVSQMYLGHTQVRCQLRRRCAH